MAENNKEMAVNMENLKEELKQNNQKNLEELKEELSRTIENNNEQINKKIEEEMTGIRREMSEIHGKWEITSHELQQTKEDFGERMTNMEEDSQIRIESIKTATDQNITQVRTDFGEKCREIDTAVSEVRGQGQQNKNKIEEIQQREIAKIREELEVINNRPPVMTQYQHLSLIHISSES